MEKDNQQAKSFFNLGWIIAFLEGEGWFIINKQKQNKNRLRYVPVIGVNTTSSRMINQIGEILSKWEVGYWVGKRRFLETKNKNQYVINIRGFKRCIKLLNIITPYMNEKKKQAELLSEYINYRMQLPKNQYNHCGEKEEKYRQKLQWLNRRGKASTTIHQGEEESQDIV
jgi:LAGLIDADG endonuclease